VNWQGLGQIKYELPAPLWIGNHIKFKVLKHRVARKAAVTQKTEKVENNLSLCSEEE